LSRSDKPALSDTDTNNQHPFRLRATRRSINQAGVCAWRGPNDFARLKE
jgi:hypothetical protein